MRGGRTGRRPRDGGRPFPVVARGRGFPVRGGPGRGPPPVRGALFRLVAWLVVGWAAPVRRAPVAGPAAEP
ncbi:hypothetical protein GCM10027300_26170 [Modestobacter lapidis]